MHIYIFWMAWSPAVCRSRAPPPFRLLRSPGTARVLLPFSLS